MGRIKGKWVKGPRAEKEELYPDFDHPLPIGPHWDYWSPDFPEGVRLKPDNSWESLKREGAFELKRYELEKTQTLTYLQDTLEEANELSRVVLEYVDFDKGEFYTQLNQEISTEQLHQFKWGGVGGSVRNQVSNIVLEVIEKEKDLICVFDDVGATYLAPYEDPLFLQAGLHYNEEVYYVVTNQQKSKALLDTCFFASGCGWHSLCLLSKYPKNLNANMSLGELDLANIATMATCIIVGAYDGEGFVFWEKNSLI